MTSPRVTTPRSSIRWRFTIWISALLVAAVGLSFAIVYKDTTSRLNTQIEHDLRGEVAQFAQSLRLDGTGSTRSVTAAARRYVSGVPFRSVSTLLFVLAPGTEPVSNHPEVFAFSHPDNDETTREQSGENALGAQMRTPHLGFSTHRLADIGPVRVLERTIRSGGTSVTVGAAEPLDTVNRAQHGVVGSFLLAGVIGAIAVLIGSFLLGARVTAPLRRMARVAARVDAGDLEPRMDVDRRRDEIAVLATSFNHMLQRLEDGFRTQREFIADASHELRTPLTVIQGQVEVLANRRNPDQTDVRRVQGLVGSEIERMRRLVDDLLLLAQSERLDFLKTESFDLPLFINQLWDGATLIADRRFELGPVPLGRLTGDPDRLAQAIRNLIANAIEHTTNITGIVRMEVKTRPAGGIAIAIIDDGPGIPPDELPRIFERFHRTGQSRAARSGGAGLGLAIVRAIVEAHGGEVSASAAPDGGARFELHLPDFRASGRSSATRA